MSSVPPFLHRILHNAWKSISLPRSKCEEKLPISSPTRVTKMRSLTVAWNHNHDSDHLPLYANGIEMEKLEYLPKGRSSLSKIILSLTFQAALVMYQPMSGSQYQPPCLLGAAMVIAFAASSSVMFIKDSYPWIAAIVDKIAFLSFALGLFVMTGAFFTGSLILWRIIAGLACVWTMLAFLMGCST